MNRLQLVTSLERAVHGHWKINNFMGFGETIVDIAQVLELWTRSVRVPSLTADICLFAAVQLFISLAMSAKTTFTVEQYDT